MVRPATVHEVKGDKMRMSIGKDKDGQDILGPWLHTTNHRGGARERRFYKKGQSLMMICPNGDLSQASILPYAPNKDFKSPDHANDTGQDEETFQLDDLRVKKTKKGYAIWLQEPQQQQQQQGQDDPHKEGTPQKRQKQDPKPDAIIQLSKDGGFTGKVGDVRVAANKDGGKVKAGKNFSTVTKEKIILKTEEGEGHIYVHAKGTPYINKPWEVGDAPEDPVKDDDKVLDESNQSQGG
jgi:hypothetical protein